MSGTGCWSIQSPAAPINTSFSTAVFATQAISAAIMPPIEWPIRLGRRSRPSASITSQPCSAKSSMSSSFSSPASAP
jgi:hypothetical protein